MAADQVSITKRYQDDHWIVEVSVLQVSGGVIPQDVLTHENTGDATLGRYVGVCSLDELQRFQVWSGQVIPKFGNRFVRYRNAVIHLPQGTQPDGCIATIRSNLASLRSELLAGSASTSVYSIT